MKDLIGYSDFEKLDVRVGLVVDATEPEWSEKLIKYSIDFGEDIGVKTLFSGIRAWYKPDELIGKKLPVIINMTPKRMGEEFSEGMVIMVDTKEKPMMIFLSEEAEVGSVVR
jgi:methionyl-tRNA synthetase